MAKNTAEIKTIDQLKTELAEARQNLAASRRSFMQGELVNPKVMGVQKKAIARLLTKIKEEEKK